MSQPPSLSLAAEERWVLRLSRRLCDIISVRHTFAYVVPFCTKLAQRDHFLARPTFAYVVPCFGQTGVRRCGMACELVPASVPVPGGRRAVGVEALSKAMRHRLGSTHARVRRPLFWPNRREKVSNGLRVCPSLRLCPWRQKSGGC